MIVIKTMQISATLRVSGDQLDPDEVTSILRVAPHVARRRGDVRVSSSGKKIVSKFGLWTWKSENALEALTINERITQLNATFAHAHAAIRDLPHAENTWIDICIVKSDAEESDASAEFLLDAKSISILHNFGLPVEFTVY